MKLLSVVESALGSVLASYALYKSAPLIDRVRRQTLIQWGRGDTQRSQICAINQHYRIHLIQILGGLGCGVFVCFATIWGLHWFGELVLSQMTKPAITLEAPESVWGRRIVVALLLLAFVGFPIAVALMIARWCLRWAKDASLGVEMERSLSILSAVATKDEMRQLNWLMAFVRDRESLHDFVWYYQSLGEQYHVREVLPIWYQGVPRPKQMPKKRATNVALARNPK